MAPWEAPGRAAELARGGALPPLGGPIAPPARARPSPWLPRPRMELEVMLSVEDARERIRQSLSPVGLEAVRAVDAFGRVLAEALNANRTQPPFATSAMDGYAVRTADLTSLPTDLNIVGRVAAGARFEGTLGPREAVAIFTGARLPDGPTPSLPARTPR
jgi:molybdopterin biosynthesis enzyme